MKEFTTIPIRSQILNFLVSVDGDDDGDGDNWRSSDYGDSCSVMMVIIGEVMIVVIVAVWWWFWCVLKVIMVNDDSGNNYDSDVVILMVIVIINLSFIRAIHDREHAIGNRRRGKIRKLSLRSFQDQKRSTASDSLQWKWWKTTILIQLERSNSLCWCRGRLIVWIVNYLLDFYLFIYFIFRVRIPSYVWIQMATKLVQYFVRHLAIHNRTISVSNAT